MIPLGMRLARLCRRFIWRHIAAPPVRAEVETARTIYGHEGPGRIEMFAGGVTSPRVTRTMFEMVVNGRPLGRASGIRVRAGSIGEAVEVVSANRGLQPRDEVAA